MFTVYCGHYRSSQPGGILAPDYQSEVKAMMERLIAKVRTSITRKPQKSLACTLQQLNMEPLGSKQNSAKQRWIK